MDSCLHSFYGVSYTWKDLVLRIRYSSDVTYTRSQAIYSHSQAIYLHFYIATRVVCFITCEELTQDY